MLYILTLIIGGIASYFLPWWCVAPICFALSAWKATSAKEAFGISAAAISTLWIGYATFLNGTAAIGVAEQIGNLFSSFLPALEKIPKTGLMFTILTLIAANVSGFAGMAGFQVRELFK